MENLRILRRRIRSVQNTQKITRAMQMVSGAKLKRSQEELLHLRPFAEHLSAITDRFLSSYPALEHPLLAPLIPSSALGGEEAQEAPVGLLFIASDTGLCGTYNERVLLLAERFLNENPSAKVIALGKKGNRFLARRGIPRVKEILDWAGRYQDSKTLETFQWMEELYLRGGVSSWWIVYTLFLSALRFKPVIERLLPIERPPLNGFAEKILLEPDQASVAEELLTRFVLFRFKRILLEAFTSEHSARMIAMKNATDNAEEMIGHLTLIRNKARQAAITKELIEVVSGAEALR